MDDTFTAGAGAGAAGLGEVPGAGGAPNRIRQLRMQRGLRQWQLAALVNATPQQVSHLERGERQLTLS